jgi:Zn-dependent protease
MSWLNLFILIPILIVSMSAHELAHGFIAYKLGDPTAKRAGRLSINPIKHLDPLGTAMFFITYIVSQGTALFGWAKPIPVSPYYFRRRQVGMAVVGAAGPVTNFLIAVIVILLVKWVFPNETGRLADILYLVFQVNVVLGVFNLLPIPPLDGSRVVGAFLPRNAYERWASLDRYGMMFVFLVIILFRGSFSSLITWVMNGLINLFL